MPTDLGSPSTHGQFHGSGGTECLKSVPLLLVGTYKEFLPKSKGLAGGALGVAVTLEVVGRLLAGEGAQKVVGLVGPKDGAEHGV